MSMTGSVSGVDLPDLDDCLRLETEFEDDDFTEGDPDFLHQSACLLCWTEHSVSKSPGVL